MRRSMPKSAPRPEPNVMTPTISKERHSDCKDHSRLGSYSVPTKRLTVSSVVESDEVTDSTPKIKKRSKLLSQGESLPIPKKLCLEKSPAVAKTKATEIPFPVQNVQKRPNQPKTKIEQIAELKADNKKKLEEIASIEKHEADVKRLTASINLWKTGAVKALGLLKAKLEPPQSVATILKHLNVPSDMFDTSSLGDDDDEDESGD